jgi:hypothetical protein
VHPSTEEKLPNAENWHDTWTSAEGEQKLEKMAQAWDQLPQLSELDRILTLADERLINQQLRP